MSFAHQEPDQLESFRTWFTENGGQIHRDIYFSPDSSGISVRTATDLPVDTTVISCPFSLAITLAVARIPLEIYCRLASDAQHKLSERQQVSAYIALHWILSEEEDSKCLLRHRPYINLLPRPETLLTPLYFSEDELNLFRGTNLYRAAFDQRIAWEAEWQSLCAAIRQGAPEIVERISWNVYLAAATYLSSRAFPSTLLSPTPSLVATPSSYPVLLPGVDSLNHARNQPVTWAVSHLNPPPNPSSGDSDLCVALMLNTPSATSTELFNNYGPKPNASLILGYGFALPENPDDTILLKIGFRSSSDASVGSAEKRSDQPGHEIGRDAKNADALWEDARGLIAANYDDLETGDDDDIRAVRDLQLDMETADRLSDMVSSLLAHLPSLTEAPGPASIRGEVRKMWEYYVQGQVDILEALLVWLNNKDSEAVRKAEELGIDVLGDDMDDE